ncbi:penicillin-binding protein 2 [Marivibrio halodurans]|uniref:Penicillin-binding protein 2 n=2 Tax=Marivibrio halodurans TaxID=2039722 RepID=A0A8J7V306_9PROT|nr:penicillin-binding protein 2 [Marivibrio halodurans]
MRREAPPSSGPTRADGVFRQAIETGRTRLLITGAVMALAFVAVSGRLVDVAAIADPHEPRQLTAVRAQEVETERAAIVDRNGVLLATSLGTVSLSANPHKLLDPVEAAQKIATVLPELDPERLASRLSKETGFVWIHRNLTPRQQERVNRLGIPGVEFHKRESRVYPQGRLLSHVLGYTDVDNKGISGLEKSFDERLRARDEPLRLSIDVRMQHVLHEELQGAIDQFSAIGGAGVVLDVKTGEVAALVSLPDFDPNHPTADPQETRFNRATLGVYELGSTFKIFNTAMALDAGTVSMAGGYDASKPLRVANYTINDFHAENRWLSVPEIFIHSSNIGSAKMALEVGPAGQKAFMQRMGFLDRLDLEVGETGTPQYPDIWRPINTMTISFGHGLSVTPLHLASGVASMLNGGTRVSPTLLKRDAAPVGARVVSPDVSTAVRKLMRLNTIDPEGSGGNANVPGYVVGGKTGTAEKIGASGTYARKALISSFVAAFPMTDPRYVVYAVLDEPKGTKETLNYATGGWVAAPMVGRVIERIAPIAGITPVDPQDPSVRLALAIQPPMQEQKHLASFETRMASAIQTD